MSLEFGSFSIAPDLPAIWDGHFGRLAGQSHIQPLRAFGTVRQASDAASLLNAYDTSAPGDAIQIVDGSTIEVTLSTTRPGTSDTPAGKIYIIGSSDSGDRGATTLAGGSRFTIAGADHLAIGNIRFADNSGVVVEIEQADGTWIYDNNLGGGSIVLHPTSGALYEPVVRRTRVVNNYFNGNYTGSAGLIVQAPFTNFNASAPFDTVVAANTFENYQNGTDYEAVSAVSWGWNHPESSEYREEPDNYFLVESNHFIDCGDEVISAKIRRFRISRNLLEYTPAFDGGPIGTPGFISLRSGDDKIVDGNIVLNNGGNNSSKAIEINGSRHHGYYNVLVRSGHQGLAFYYGSQESIETGDLGVWFSNMPVKDNVWRHNFLGDDVTGWIRIKTGNVADEYAPSGNVVTNNFYGSVDPPTFIDSGSMPEEAWEAANPESTAEAQHFGVPAGDVYVLPTQAEIPDQVVVPGWGISGDDALVEMPPWIGFDSDSVLTLHR